VHLRSVNRAQFDNDSDGVLSAPEIADALRSRGVKIDTEQVQWLIDTFEQDRACNLPMYNSSINRSQWSNFVYSLTVSDLHIDEDLGRKKQLSSDG